MSFKRVRKTEKAREREREKQMLHNNDCIVEYNSKICIKTAQMYAKVHVHHVYTATIFAAKRQVIR